MLKTIFRGPEAAGYIVLGATAGAAMTSLLTSSLMAAWAGGTAGAVVLPVTLALPWGSLIRRASIGWTSSAI